MVISSHATPPPPASLSLTVNRQVNVLDTVGRTSPVPVVTFPARTEDSCGQVLSAVVEGGKLTMIDEEELTAKVKERAPKIISRFLNRLG